MRALIVCFICFGLFACGYGESEETRYVRKKRENPKPDKWAELSTLVDAACGSCHGDGKAQAPINSLERLQESKPRIENDSMPPGGGLDPEVKAKFLGA